MIEGGNMTEAEALELALAALRIEIAQLRALWQTTENPGTRRFYERTRATCEQAMEVLERKVRNEIPCSN
jgi:hypothetical protein